MPQYYKMFDFKSYFYAQLVPEKLSKYCKFVDDEKLN